MDQSEFILILEFKLSDNKDFNKSILGLDFSPSPEPVNTKNYDLSKLQYHLKHQLRERTYFVKPPDKIVGNIYFDYGNILAQTENIEAAIESYKAAKEYGFESNLMNQRIEEFESLSRKGKIKGYAMEFFKSNVKTIVFSVLVIIFAITGLILYKIRKRKYVR